MVEDRDVNITVDPNTKPKRVYDGGKRVDEDRTPVLMQNDLGRFFFTPEHKAVELEKESKAIRITPDMADYVEAFKMALGKRDGFATGMTIQVKGEWKKPEELGRTDINAMIEQAKADAEKYGPKADGKIVLAKEMPTGAADFDARLRKRKFGR